MTSLEEKTPGRDSALREMAASRPLSLRIQGSCMAPLLKDGARVRIRSRRVYLPGDVLVFRSRQGQVFVHRFLGCFFRRGSLRYVTRADTASHPDCSVEHCHIIGRVCGGEVSPQVSSVPLAQRLRSLGHFFAYALRCAFTSRQRK